MQWLQVWCGTSRLGVRLRRRCRTGSREQGQRYFTVMKGWIDDAAIIWKEGYRADERLPSWETKVENATRREIAVKKLVAFRQFVAVGEARNIVGRCYPGELAFISNLVRKSRIGEGWSIGVLLGTECC